MKLQITMGDAVLGASAGSDSPFTYGFLSLPASFAVAIRFTLITQHTALSSGSDAAYPKRMCVEQRNWD